MNMMIPSCLEKHGFSKKDKLFMHETDYLCRLRYCLARIELFKQEVDQLNDISNSKNPKYFGCKLSLEAENMELMQQLNEEKNTFVLEESDLLSMDAILSKELREQERLSDDLTMMVIATLTNIEHLLLTAFNKINQVGYNQVFPTMFK